ncbi:MAG TPA: transposase [Chthoniobacterales bacterium]|nr:transposase [Chthoniobacterales bacterium]
MGKADHLLCHFCVKDRRNVLANPDVFEAIKATITQLRGWHILAGAVMPDHAHWIVGPRLDREISVGDFSNAFKRLLRKTPVEQDWEWRRGCFADDWPYHLDFINDEKDNL